MHDNISKVVFSDVKNRFETLHCINAEKKLMKLLEAESALKWPFGFC